METTEAATTACPHHVKELNEVPAKDKSYSSYLQLDSLLNTVIPISSVHDENLFLTVHQVYELWFKQIIIELDSIRKIFHSSFLDDRHMLTVNTRLSRIVKIFNMLADQMMILETMTPMDFAEFRDVFKSSSGFQSWQFRIIENKLGVKPENRIRYNQCHYTEAFEGELKDLVKISEDELSLFQIVEMWLERTPGLKDEAVDFWGKFTENCQQWFNQQQKLIEVEENCDLQDDMRKAYKKKKETFETILIKEKYEASILKGERNLSWDAFKGALMIYFYRDEMIFHGPYQMISLLVDIDSLMMKWRSNHLLLVQRQIGTKAGSHGSSGYLYLRSTMGDRYKAFLDFFNLSNYLIPREFVPQIHTSMRNDEFTHFNGTVSKKTNGHH